MGALCQYTTSPVSFVKNTKFVKRGNLWKLLGNIYLASLEGSLPRSVILGEARRFPDSVHIREEFLFRSTLWGFRMAANSNLPQNAVTLRAQAI